MGFQAFRISRSGTPLTPRTGGFHSLDQYPDHQASHSGHVKSSLFQVSIRRVPVRMLVFKNRPVSPAGIDALFFYQRGKCQFRRVNNVNIFIN